jgi:hypothetical protein
MAFSRTYDLQLFNSTNAILYLKIYLYWNSTLLDTVESFPVQLPVNSLGQVPTGTALTAEIDRVLAAVYNPEVLQLKKNIIDASGEVSNAAGLFSLTAGDERQLRGVIYDIFGNPVEGAEVQSLRSGSAGAVITGPTGAYSLPAYEGSESVLVLSPAGASPPYIWPRRQITAISGSTTLDITVVYEDGYGSNIVIADADTQEQTVTNTGRTFDNAEVVLPAGSVVDSNGDPVSDVIVSIANNVVSDLGMASTFPGFFLGTSNSYTGPIESYGFIDVRLSPLTGSEVYSLDPTKPATIRIPVYPDPVGIDTIPLWRLDETTGIWEQTGEATRVGSTTVFEAQVTTFSYYNLDRPMVDPVVLTVTAYNYNTTFNSIPAPGVAVTIDILDSAYYGNAIWQGRGITNANGQLVISAPAGFLRVVGKKDTATYNGYGYNQGAGTASIDLYPDAPPLEPPPPSGNIDLIMAAGNTYSPATTRFLIVEDATALAIATGGPYYPTFSGFDVYVIDILDNTIELSGDVILSANLQAEGATISFVEG